MRNERPALTSARRSPGWPRSGCKSLHSHWRRNPKYASGGWHRWGCRRDTTAGVSRRAGERPSSLNPGRSCGGSAGASTCGRSESSGSPSRCCKKDTPNDVLQLPRQTSGDFGSSPSNVLHCWATRTDSDGQLNNSARSFWGQFNGRAYLKPLGTTAGSGILRALALQRDARDVLWV